VGNRRTKDEAVAFKDVTYTYDVDDPGTYGSCSNRLMKYVIDDAYDTEDETVWYTYDLNGNVTRVIRKYDNSDQYRSTWMTYDSSGKVHYVIGETWNDDGLDEKGRHRTETTYLFSPPELFGLDHFPEDPKWQLRAEPLELGDFMRQPGIRPRFVLLDLKLRQPQRSQVTVSGRFDAVIENPRGAYLMAYARTGESRENEIACEVQRGEITRITCELDEPGRYSVHLYGNKEAYGSYAHIAELFVNNR